MDVNDIYFTVHDYDFEGDICDEGIFLHFGETRVKVAETLDDFKAVADRISGMTEEVAWNLSAKAGR